MPGATIAPSYICARCLRASQRARRPNLPQSRRWLSASPRQLRDATPAADEPASPAAQKDAHDANAARDGKDKKRRDEAEQEQEQEPGAMSRRLADLTEEGLVSGGRRAQKAVTEDAGFSEELRKQLEERIAAANFRNDYAQGIAQAELPQGVGAGTRDIAGAAPWLGTESVADASLRMLNDSIKPMRGPPRGPPGVVVRPPTRVDTGQAASAKGASSGTRLASAMDRTSMYSLQKDANVSDEEREKLRREMKERFQPGARGGPMSVRALESLANERIEDAIARGQFKNIKRGGKLERDYNASNPFLDTTEYFMNKIIQKQDIVPPWIEKQQELVQTASRFRSRLRADWRRHAARMIASKGGSLESQIRRAQAFAGAERIFNPKKGAKIEKITTVISGDPTGTLKDEDHLSQISLAGELTVKPASDIGDEGERITVTATPLSDGKTSEEGTSEILTEVTVSEEPTAAPTDSPSSTAPPPVPAADHPFRDPAWEAAERSFLSLSVDQLNALTRSYNLMAPDLAKKPYFSLERELAACFADVAPTVADEIHARALQPKARLDGPIVGHRPGGVLKRFGTRQEVKVHDERRRQYGFKEFWKDLWAGGEKA